MKPCGCGCGEMISGRANYARGHHWSASRFGRYVEQDRGYKSPCWIWRGVREAKGYARVTHCGRRQFVHRLFYEHFVGQIPEGMAIDHLCKTRCCCNPKHLEAVTHSENSKRVHRDLAADLFHLRGKYWVGNERDRLRRMLEAGLTDAEIARALERTVPSVGWVRRGMGYMRRAAHQPAILVEGK